MHHWRGIAHWPAAALVALGAWGCAVNEAGVNYGPGVLHPDRSWLENRGIDFADIFTLNVGGGYGLHGELHATHVVAAGGGYARTWNFGASERPREYGVWENEKWDITLPMLSHGRVRQHHLWGAIEENHEDPLEAKMDDLQTPLDPVYQDLRDYWGFGGSATLGVVSAQLEVHPLQIFDFVINLFGWDSLADEF